MPTNQNAKLPLRHVLYLAKSGSGKSQAVKWHLRQLAGVKRVLLWDAARDHDILKGGRRCTDYYDDINAFGRAAADMVESKRGGRIAYDGERDLKTFERWCRIAWLLADGKQPLHLVIEDYQAVCNTNGEVGGYHGKLWNEGRKYGLHIHAAAIRPQSLPKNAYGNTYEYWFGTMTSNTAKYVGNEVDIDDYRDFCTLGELEFFRYCKGQLTPQKLTYKEN